MIKILIGILAIIFFVLMSKAKNYFSARKKLIIAAGFAGILAIGIILNPYQYRSSTLIIVSVIILGIFFRYSMYLRHQDDHQERE